MNLRTKTSLFFGIFFITVTVVIVFFIESIVGNTFKKQITTDFFIIAEQSEGTYFSFLNGLKIHAINWLSDANVQNLSRNVLKTKSGTPERVRSEKDFLTYFTKSKMPYHKTVLIVDLLDKNGIVIASTKSDRIGTNELDDELKLGAHHFSKAINSSSGEVFIKSFVFEADESDKPMTHVAVRVFGLNEEGIQEPFDAVLLIHFTNTDEIAHALGVGVLDTEGTVSATRVSRTAFLESYKTSDIYMVNSDSIIVTPSRHMMNVQLMQKVGTLPVRECIDNKKEITAEYENFQGVRVLGASMCFPDDGLVLIVEVQKDEIFAPLDTIKRITFAGGITVIVVGILIAVFFVRRPLAHLSDIVKVARLVKDGDLNVKVDVKTQDEIGMLGSIFNTMIASLRFTQTELQESKNKIEEKAKILQTDVEKHKKQEKFLDESKRATLNLLEDSWKAKERLEEEGYRLQTILTSIGDGLILVDGAYIITLINNVAMGMLGMKREELVGKDLRTVVTLWKKQKDVIPNNIWPTEEVFLTKKVVTGTLEQDFSISTQKHQEKIPIVFSISPLGGGLSGVVITFRDASKERELDDAKSGFISVASHQLRTPLTSIRWYSEMLLSEDAGALNDTQKDFMKEVHGGAERLYQTVDLLLGISRVESGKMKSDRTQIDLGLFTAEIAKELAPQIDMKELALAVVPPEGAPVSVLLDSLTLRQVILNLISNAIRYTNPKGIIEIKWWLNDEGKEVVYMVHDNGIGIPESQRSRIFSKFFRAENARAQVPDGSGLGLALVKDLVISWGGRVWFETEEGKGTNFFFTVPLHTEVADIDEHGKIEGKE